MCLRPIVVLCGGFNGNLIRAALDRWKQLKEEVPECRLEISGKRGIGGFKFRGHVADQTYTHFEDRPSFTEVELIANRYLDEYTVGAIDRLDVVYMKYESVSRQNVSVETLLPLGSLGDSAPEAELAATSGLQYDFLPSPESILRKLYQPVSK